MGSAEPLHQFLGMELVCTWNAGPGTLAGDDTLLVCSGMGAAHYWADAAGRSLCAEWPAACESQVRPRNRGTGEGHLGRLAFGPWWSGLHAEFRLWRSWSCFRGFGSLAARSCSVILHVLHYMRYHLLWPRFLDDKAAVCNGLRIWAKCRLFPERNLCRSS